MHHVAGALQRPASGAVGWNVVMVQGVAVPSWVPGSEGVWQEWVGMGWMVSLLVDRHP